MQNKFPQLQKSLPITPSYGSVLFSSLHCFGGPVVVLLICMLMAIAGGNGDFVVAKDPASEQGRATGFVEGPQGRQVAVVSWMGKTWVSKNLDLVTEDSWCYGNDTINCIKYGRLYTWEAANKACRSLGPGWRLPNESEWRYVASLFGGCASDSKDRGRKAYRALTVGGNSGVNLLHGGFRFKNGQFHAIKEGGFYWTNTRQVEDRAQRVVFYEQSEEFYLDQMSTTFGYSCRCVKE